MRELAEIEHVAEEQREEVEEERAENARTQTARECGMSVWRVVCEHRLHVSVACQFGGLCVNTDRT